MSKARRGRAVTARCKREGCDREALGDEFRMCYQHEKAQLAHDFQYVLMAIPLILAVAIYWIVSGFVG